MDLFTLMVAIAVIGLALWAINRWIPMEPELKRILTIVVIVGVVIWILSVFGLFHYLHTIKVGTV